MGALFCMWAGIDQNMFMWCIITINEQGSLILRAYQKEAELESVSPSFISTTI
jgi:hypothetical protein